MNKPCFMARLFLFSLLAITARSVFKSNLIVYRFSASIKTSIGTRVFLFRRVFVLDGMQYNVTVFGRVTNTYFSVIYSDNEWQFLKPLLVAGWIAEVEAEIMYALAINHVD